MLIDINNFDKRKSWYICDKCGNRLTGVNRNIISINNKKKADLCIYCCNLIENSLKEPIKKKYDFREEEINFLKNNIARTYTRDIAKLFNEKYNYNFTINEIKYILEKFNLKSGITEKKAVIQLDKNNREIKHYNSITEASKLTGIRYSSLVNCLKGMYNTSGGYKWKYAVLKKQ